MYCEYGCEETKTCFLCKYFIDNIGYILYKKKYFHNNCYTKYLIAESFYKLSKI